MGAHRQDANRQRRADHRRAGHVEARRRSGKTGARHRPSDGTGIHGGTARDVGRRCVDLRSHSDHGDDDRRCGRVGPQPTPGFPGRRPAHGCRPARNARRSCPAALPARRACEDQEEDDPAIAAAAAAGLIAVAAQPRRAQPADFGAACAARRDSSRHPYRQRRRNYAAPVESVERAGRRIAAEPRTTAADTGDDDRPVTRPRPPQPDR